MAADTTEQIVRETEGQCAGSGAPGGQWKQPAEASDTGNACNQTAEDVETEPAHAAVGGAQLVTAREVAVSPGARDGAEESDGAAAQGNSACEDRAVADGSEPTELEESHQAEDAGAEATLAAAKVASDARAEQSDADADAARRTDGSCSTDVSMATTVTPRDKGGPIASARKRRRTRPALTQEVIDKQLHVLSARAEEKRAHLAQQEAEHARGRARLAQLEHEVTELTAAVDRCVAKKREHKRIERLMRGRRDDDSSGSESSSSSSSSESSSSQGARRRHRSADREEGDATPAACSAGVADGVAQAPGSDEDGLKESEQQRKRKRRLRRKKPSVERERRRLRRFRDDLALRFQLLRSECQRSELQVDKLVADLRREYTDAYLFAAAEFP